MDFKVERIRAGLSLNDVSRLTGFSKSHVAAVERGTTGSSLQYKEAFQRAINSENQGAIITQKPIVKLLGEISVLSREAQSQNQKLAESAKTIQAIVRLNAQIIDLVSTITQRQLGTATETANIFKAGPASADIENDKEASQAAANYIIEALWEALSYWKLQRYNDKFQDDVIAYVVAQTRERLDSKN